MLGSDYPFDMADTDPVGLLNACEGLSAAQKQTISADVAIDFFGLE